MAIIMAIIKHIKRWFTEEAGSTAIEYGLLAALISVAILTFSSSSLTSVFNNVGTAITSVDSGLSGGGKPSSDEEPETTATEQEPLNAGDEEPKTTATEQEPLNAGDGDCAGKSGENGEGKNCNNNNNSQNNNSQNTNRSKNPNSRR